MENTWRSVAPMAFKVPKFSQAIEDQSVERFGHHDQADKQAQQRGRSEADAQSRAGHPIRDGDAAVGIAGKCVKFRHSLADGFANVLGVIAGLESQKEIGTCRRIFLDVLGCAIIGCEGIGRNEKTPDSLGEANDPGSSTVQFADIAQGGIFQFSFFADDPG